MRWPIFPLATVLLALAAGCGKPEHEAGEAGEPAAKAESETNSDQITLSDEALESAKLQVTEVRAGSGVITTRFPGTIEFNANATAVVQPPMEGRLREWLINAGDGVKRDDVLARVDNPQNLGAAMQLRAPIDGEVIERGSTAGDWVKPGDKLAVITDPTTLWAVARVGEDLAGAVLTNEPARIHILSLSNEIFTGTTLRAGASVDPETRTVEFVFVVPNIDRRLRAGMFAQISLATGRVENKLLVPDEAVQLIKGRQVVFVEEARGKYRLTPVQLGRKLGESYEVLGGLPDGARVVGTGSFLLKSEALRGEFSED